MPRDDAATAQSLDTLRRRTVGRPPHAQLPIVVEARREDRVARRDLQQISRARASSSYFWFLSFFSPPSFCFSFFLLFPKKVSKINTPVWKMLRAPLSLASE